MNDLGVENQRLRKAVSDLTLDKLILQEAAQGSVLLATSVNRRGGRVTIGALLNWLRDGERGTPSMPVHSLADDVAHLRETLEPV